MVNYNYGTAGGSLIDEANAWTNAAHGAFNPTQRPLLKAELGILDTLKALLTERKIAEILRDRGTDWWTNLTLFPFRPSDAGRVNPSRELLASLETHTNKEPPVYLLQSVFNTVADQIDNRPSGRYNSLKAITADIYRISSHSNNAAPGTYPPPVDVLRQFIWSGVIHANYLPHLGREPEIIDLALAGVTDALASVTSRPATNLTLQVARNSFTDSCTKLQTLLGVPKNLFDAAGNPFRFPDAFSLLPGNRVQVCGYTDIVNAACDGDDIEVISVTLDTIVVGSDLDGDGDLLVDSWERLFLGGLGGDPFGDDDGDGFQNLQEMFDGTDPNDRLGHAADRVSLGPPLIQIDPPAGGQIRLRWSWPSPYVGRIRFGLRASPGLADRFEDVPGLSDVPNVAGQFDVTLNLPEQGPPGAYFFYVYLALR
jgi:hypothetical protein